MPASTAATAILHFIGLVVFSRQLAPPQDPHLIALMPRVPVVSAVPHAHTMKVASTASPLVEPPTPALGVETHTAIIAFASSSRLRTSRGWRLQNLKTVPGMKYVALDGDRVSIKGGRSQADVTGASNDVGGLPHLTQCCTGVKGLKAPFRAPFAGAAAVVDLREGRVNACRYASIAKTGRPDGMRQPGRVDTRVQLDNTGTITIVLTKGTVTREITLDGKAEVYFANVPSDFLLGKDNASLASLPHFQAYWDMTETDGGAHCTAFLCAATAKLPDCAADFTMGGVVPDPTIPQFPEYFTNFECSNTQYP